ncbi:hypothetical protein NQ318_013798 [Aromia moschata]|uniref:Bromo domain-containing protein n=1 Tax=Aromia moschata TaxID=1265417 RepID=A0AAV8ZBJ1_9CUCU|nr:hypothetical protein NQ318_013798 [Aromia moschata]
MSKRRRTSSITSRGHEDDSLDSIEASTSSGPTMRKRKKNLDPMELCHQLYDIIRNHKKDDGTVPKRRQEPGYYDVVSNPIDLLKVQQKLKTDEYDDLDDLQSDIELIVIKREGEAKRPANNRHNNRHSKRTPARQETRNSVNHNDDANESLCEEDEANQYEDLFAAVMAATDDNNKLLHTAFQLLPSKKKYPEYYEVIEQPIDLKMIAAKVQNSRYGSLAEMERDLLLMCKNACLFNEPGSQIYKHAKALKKAVQTKKLEVEHSAAEMKSPNKTPTTSKLSERIRNKRLRGNSSLSAVTAALKTDESEPEQEEDVSAVSPADADNPQWKLFEAVRTVTGYNGVPLSEPFWKLPSRRFYPDYYREIKNPVSLTQIRRKLTNKACGTVSEVAGDMTIMFENAKKYNVPTSKLYKDAVKLQKLMQTKVQELLDIDQSFFQDTDNDIDLEPVRKKPGPKPKNPTPGNTPTRGDPPKTPYP